MIEVGRALHGEMHTPKVNSQKRLSTFGDKYPPRLKLNLRAPAATRGGAGVGFQVLGYGVQGAGVGAWIVG